MMKTLRLLILACAALAPFAGPVAAQGGGEPIRVLGPDGTRREGATPQNTSTVRVIGSDGREETVAAPVLSDVERYCVAIADPARDARAALQTERLQALEVEIDARIDELEAKRAEYEEWLEKRQAFLDSTSAIMLDIYASMRPDAAAAQLAGLDREAAAAIIARLKSRQASAILTEMPAPVAAEIAGVIVTRTDRGSDLQASAGTEVRS
ncbi:MotE family protein [Aureimonas mangrovi]|uniref:MotE family protein n=1 Tax=Aureimonas mangrovi TaxID=2758041 RepID=UPI001AEE736B|nr:MotE family protein [Aureimonas mangrovi]